jgi:hypothetical protein
MTGAHHLPSYQNPPAGPVADRGTVCPPCRDRGTASWTGQMPFSAFRVDSGRPTRSHGEIKLYAEKTPSKTLPLFFVLTSEDILKCQG